MASQAQAGAPAPTETPTTQQENPWDDKTKKQFRSKEKSEYLDPCQAAASRSIKCLHRNGGDRAMCGEYFQAYRDCKKAWLEKLKEEKKKNGASLW